jgi:ABC-type Fe3+-siderophore transport system permease subunit
MKILGSVKFGVFLILFILFYFILFLLLTSSPLSIVDCDTFVALHLGLDLKQLNWMEKEKRVRIFCK